jgi:simple sugar transport system ATP-binding protein
VIAREFSGNPRVVCTARPFYVRASAAVHDRLRAARDGGAGVLLISEDLDEILLLADRVGVMNRGRIAAEFAAPVDRHAVGRALVHHG